jgi:alkyl hydroperoxide reductase subunit AhpC
MKDYDVNPVFAMMIYGAIIIVILLAPLAIYDYTEARNRVPKEIRHSIERRKEHIQFKLNDIPKSDQYNLIKYAIEHDYNVSIIRNQRLLDPDESILEYTPGDRYMVYVTKEMDIEYIVVLDRK